MRAVALNVSVGPSMAEWLLGTLDKHGPKTLDELGRCLPERNWAQLLLAVDQLSREGDITVQLHAHSDYLISLTPPQK